ncbi:MAG: hypothetical protein ACRENK_07155 [Gemmatimonadaceae bacterium]
MTTHQAILRGHLVVNGPVLLIIGGVAWLASLFTKPASSGAGFGLLAGCFLAWPWWSFAAPRWRRWALAQGVHPVELQQAAVQTGLVWPKGSVFEKTELPPRDPNPPGGRNQRDERRPK